MSTKKWYILQITFAQFSETLPLFSERPRLPLHKRRRDSWVKLAQMCLWRRCELSFTVCYLCPGRDRIRTSLCPFRSHVLTHTALGWGCERTPPRPCSASRWALPMRDLRMLRLWRRPPLGAGGRKSRVVSEVASPLGFSVQSSFRVLMSPEFVFVFTKRRSKPLSRAGSLP